jgi:transposase-like protein
MDEINPQCPHTALTPHWENPNDMGKKELATYTCEACHETFNYEQAKQFLDHAPAVVASVEQ